MAELIEEATSGKARAVTLIEGDEYLARTSARELADAIVPEKDRALNRVARSAACAHDHANSLNVRRHEQRVAHGKNRRAVDDDAIVGAGSFDEELGKRLAA